ncbi:MAG: hypothetical protein JNK05_39275 [Myxococcales bacterium]|nr:hypothetical protein [Myxococcales bacterium]
MSSPNEGTTPASSSPPASTEAPPYRAPADGQHAAARDSSPSAPSATSAIRTKRSRYLLAAAAISATVLGIRALRQPRNLEAPPELLDPGNRFPLATAELPVAAPLAPLLARDEPEHLSLLEPSAGSSRVLRGGSVRIRFNRVMVRAAEVNRALGTEGDGAAPVHFDPPVQGTFRWVSRSTLAFEPAPEAFERTNESKIVFTDRVRSLAGERFDEDPEERVVVFAGGAMALTDLTPRRVLPGEPLRLMFSGPPDMSTVSSQMVTYESGGAQRALRFSLAPRGRDPRGNYGIDVRLDRTLEPGARVAMLLSPNLVAPYDDGEGEYGTRGPTELVVELRPRPRIEGFACSEGAESAEGCSHQGTVEGIVDIEDTLRLYASSALDPRAAPVVRVNPPLANQRVVAQNHSLAITGEWAPDQVYEVRVEGLRDTEGTPLQRMQALAVRSSGKSPSIQVREGVQVYERAGAATLPFTAVNVGRGALRYLPLEPGRDLAFALDRAPEAWSSAQTIALAGLAPTSRPNRTGPGAFRFVSSTEGRTSSIAAIAFQPAGANDRAFGQRAIVQHTDLGVSARVFSQGVLVWVSSIATGRPVANAEVTLAWANGSSMRTASPVRTDGNGLVWIAAPEGINVVDVPLALSARTGDDRAVLSLDPRTSVTPSTLGLAQGASNASDGQPIAAVFADRGAYRPGDSLHIKAVIRQPTVCAPRARPQGQPATSASNAPCNPEEVRAFARQPVRISLINPSDNSPVVERTVRTNAWGTVDATFALPASAMAGQWRIAVSKPRDATRELGSHYVTVAEFRPPTMRVDLRDVPEAPHHDEPLAVRVESRYLFGAPVARATAHWTLHRERDGEYPMPWVRTFVFAPVDADERRSLAGSGEIELAQDGTATIQTRTTMNVPTRQSFTLETEVRDASGQSTAARRSFTVYPATYEVGVKRTAPWLGPGAALDVEAIVIDHGGTAIAGQSVQARIVREGWDSYYEWTHRGDGEDGYRARRTRDEREVARCQVQSEREPVHCRFQPTEPGVYRLEAKVVDANNRESIASQRVYVAAPGEHPDRDAPGAPITVTPTQSSYPVGERASVAFESPWPDAEALVVVAREGVLHTERRRVRAGGNVFEFELTPAMVPNAFVHVSLVRPRTGEPGAGLDLEAPDLRLGVTEVRVRPRVSALNVGITLPTQTARPGDEIPIEVAVRNADGRGVRAEVALYVVDEGTLRLSSYETPRPGDQFFPRRAPRFVLDDLRRSLVSRLEIPALPGASGDGSEDGERALRDERERFEPTPLWLPHLNTGVDGIARARVRLPQRPTQYRVIAVVNDSAARTGGASTQLTATLPAVLRPTMPTAVVEGDRFEAVTFVHNPGTAPVDVRVRALVGGREVRAENIRLDAGGDSRVSFPMEAAVGQERMDVRFEAIAQGATDARDVTVAVRPRGIAQRSFMAGAVTGTRSIELEAPQGAMARGARFTVTVAPHPFVGMEAAADMLDESPYENVESLASRVLGLVAYASMATDPARAADARRRGESAAERLVALQTYSGGFGQWTSTDEPWMYGSVYALDALVTAKAAGWTLPAGALDRAETHVNTLLTNGSLVDYESATRNDVAAYAARVLVRAGKSLATRISSLYDQKETLSPFGAAQLALAMPANDRRRETLAREAARRMLSSLDAIARAEANAAQARANSNGMTPAQAAAYAPTSFGSARWFESSTRSLAALVRVTAELLPGGDESRRLASYLLRRRDNGAWNGTHDNAHSLVALAALARRFTDREMPRARVTLDGAVIAEARPSGEGPQRARVFTLPAERLLRGRHQLVIDGAENTFFALDGRWLRALSAQDNEARGRVAALHRVIERENGERVSAETHVRAGELLRVRLFVFSERELPPNVLVRDPMGGGLDPVDRGLDTTPRASLDAILGGSTEDEVVDPRGFHAARSLSYLSHRAFNRGEARFFADRAGAGLLEFTYAVRATTPGTFALLPTEIRAQHDPQWVARSAATTITVDR